MPRLVSARQADEHLFPLQPHRGTGPLRTPRRLMQLSDHHYRNLAAICVDVAQVSLASIAVPFLVDKFEPALAFFGVVAAVTFWLLSFLALNRVT